MADITDISLEEAAPVPEEVAERAKETATAAATAGSEALQELAEDARRHPGVRDIVREAAALGPLLAVIGSAEAEQATREAALSVVYHCSIENEQNPSVIAAEGGMPILSGVIGADSPFSDAARVHAVGALFNVTSFLSQGGEAEATADIIANVVGMLSSKGDEDGRAWAAGTLQNLAGGHPEHRRLIGETPQAVQTMLSMATSPETGFDTRRIIVAALYNLTIESDANQAAILLAQGVEAFTGLLHAGLKTLAGALPAEEAEAAAAAGGGEGEEAPGVAVDSDMEVGVITVGYAAGALQNLVYDRPEEQAKLFGKGGVAALLKLLALGMPEATGEDGLPVDVAEEEAIMAFHEMRTNAAGALFNATGGHNPEIDAFMGRGANLEVVVEAVVTTDPELRTNAAGVLFNVTCELEENKTGVADAGGVDALVGVLEEMDTEAVAWACGALFNLTTLPQLADAVAEAGAVPLLVSNIRSTDDGRIATWSAGILNHITKFSGEHGAAVVEEDGLDVLIALAVQEFEEEQDMSKYSQECLQNLAGRDKAWRRQIIDKGGGEAVNATLFEVCCGC